MSSRLKGLDEVPHNGHWFVRILLFIQFTNLRDELRLQFCIKTFVTVCCSSDLTDKIETNIRSRSNRFCVTERPSSNACRSLIMSGQLPGCSAPADVRLVSDVTRWR